MQVVSPINGLRTPHAITTRNPLTRTYLVINYNKQRFFRRKVIVAQLVTNISEGHPASSFYNEGETSMFLRNYGRHNNIQGFTVLLPEKKYWIVSIKRKQRVSYDATVIISLKSINRHVFCEGGTAFLILLRWIAGFLCRGAQIVGTRSSWRLNFVRWRLLFVGHATSHHSCTENFEVAPRFLKNLCIPGVINLKRKTKQLQRLSSNNSEQDYPV